MTDSAPEVFTLQEFQTIVMALLNGSPEGADTHTVHTFVKEMESIAISHALLQGILQGKIEARFDPETEEFQYRAHGTARKEHDPPL